MRLLDAMMGRETGADRVVPPTGYTATVTIFAAAAMAFLAVFALAFTVATERLADTWRAALSQTATVRIMAPEGERAAQTERVLQILRETPGVASARALTPEEQAALLAPWLGPDVPVDVLPVPQLVEVVETEAGFDPAGLRLRFQGETPGAVLDDHTRWRRPLIEAAGRMRWVGLVALALILATTAAIITLAANAALAANRQVISVLRLVGAEDGYIVRAFTSVYLPRWGRWGGWHGFRLYLGSVHSGARYSGFDGAGVCGLGVAVTTLRAAPQCFGGVGCNPCGGAANVGGLTVRQIVEFLFMLQMYAMMLIMGIVFLPWAIVHKDGARAACKTYCRWVFWTAKHMVGIERDVRGTVPDGACLVAAKHQSFFDIMILFEALPNALFIMKREILWTPGIGLYAWRMGCGPVNRGKKGAAIKRMLDDVASGARHPGQLVIYPQGTRVPPGVHERYKVGTGALYESLQQSCYPVAVNVGHFWPRKGITRVPGLAVVEMLEPIEPGLSITEFMERLEREVEAASDALSKEVI